MEERTHLGLACAAELRDVADEALHDRAMAVGAVTVVRLGAARPLDVLSVEQRRGRGRKLRHCCYSVTEVVGVGPTREAVL